MFLVWTTFSFSGASYKYNHDFLMQGLHCWTVARDFQLKEFCSDFDSGAQSCFCKMFKYGII